MPEGKRFDPLVTQYHYKDDPLHDPMLDESYIKFMVDNKGATEYTEMRKINDQVFEILEEAFAQFKIQLIDFKLEYGIIDGKVTLIDEITGGSFRLWPYATDEPNLDQENVLEELDPSGRLDKDTYRMGGDLGMVQSKFEAIAEITGKFKDLP
jgi:phosphoribosylaminoimidazole-succinocarboxamide synthase